jgi:hypothetical protein
MPPSEPESRSDAAVPAARCFGFPSVQIFRTSKRGQIILAVALTAFVAFGVLSAGLFGHSNSARLNIRATLAIYIGLFIVVGMMSDYIRRWRRQRKIRLLPKGEYFVGEALSRPLVSQGRLKDRGDFVINDRGFGFAPHRSELIPAHTLRWSDISHITLLGRRLVLTLPDGTSHEYQVFDPKVVADVLSSLANGVR